ncbi:MAG: DUF5686 and carboxypeptidase regulatory-like domain-containing protein [Bacteroidales bacterium]|nr:DUF5686 and carboxypeptidase regulatory-like domain-containing protein [Bacteroidales bacterium]
MPRHPSFISTIVYLLAALFPFAALAQTTVEGKVTDAETFEPVVFANVIFKGTSTGARTDFDGRFRITSAAESDSIVVSFIGYQTRSFAFMRGTSQVVEIQLHPALYSLNEVRVKPGENPAHQLLRKMWNNLETNSIRELESYIYNNYSRSTLYLRKFGNREAKEDNTGLFAREYDRYAVSTGDEGFPALPSYITESVSSHHYLRSAGREYKVIKAVNSEGMAFENTDLISQLITKQEEFYFPDNTVRIIDKDFISPASRFGLLYYRYYIADTVILDGKYRCYELRVIPKSDEGPVFRGSIWINDTTFALKRISLEADRKAEINFISRIRIQQDYEPSEAGAWFPVRTRFLADAVNIFFTNFSEKSAISVNKPFDPDFYGSELKVAPDARNYSREFWESNRTSSLERIDSLAFSSIDSLKRNPKMRISAKLTEASIRGYYNFGWLEAGPWILSYSRNNIEGNRFRLGGRTNASFSKTFVMEGYLAYGTLDRRLKGSIRSEIFLSKEHWTKFGLQYHDDIENTGAIDEFYSGSSFLTFASSFGGSELMNRSRLVRTWLESDLTRGLTGRLVFTRRHFEPAGPFNPVWFTNLTRTKLSASFTTSEIGILLRYQPAAVYVVDGVRRFPVNFNKYPVFRFEYFSGYEDILGGDYSYDRLSAGISHNFNAGGLGTFDYEVTFTRVNGQLPFPLLVTLPGNESVFRTSRTYNLMNYGEFVLDEALELYGSWHMNGLILNKIPLIKKLQLRTVLSGRAAFGSFDDKSNGFYDPVSNPAGILYMLPGSDPGTVFHNLSYREPYIELSYGIENIFSILRVDLVHRLTWLENPGARRFGVMVSGVFRF